MKFKTQYNTKPSPPELGGGEKLVETAGYIPAHKQINNLINAGQRLVAARAEMYDFPDGAIDENFNDPTRNGNFDLADASQLALQVEAHLRRPQAHQTSSSGDTGSTSEPTEVIEQA
nr:MAG: hypothetical protein [Microvirus sp.]